MAGRMTNDLRETLEGLATSFAQQVIASLREASIEDMTTVRGLSARRGPGRPAGRGKNVKAKAKAKTKAKRRGRPSKKR